MPTLLLSQKIKDGKLKVVEAISLTETSDYYQWEDKAVLIRALGQRFYFLQINGKDEPLILSEVDLLNDAQQVQPYKYKASKTENILKFPVDKLCIRIGSEPEELLAEIENEKK